MSYAREQAHRVERAILYRSVNERVAELNVGLDVLGDMAGQWICECADTACVTPISATVEEYQSVRVNARRFIVAPGHVDPGVERVVKANDRFVIVEKIGEAAEAAELQDRLEPGTGRRFPVFA
jgi:hypothetical protein